MSSTSEPVTVRVPGKINLHLAVGALRADGFHELRNVFHAVDLFDEVVAAPADGLSVIVEAADALGGSAVAGVPTDARNSAWQAAASLARAYGVPADVRLTLRKRIPVAGGMAGGSADAAGAFLACARLWGLADDREAVSELADAIGSDVAFALLGGTALGTGRGEQLTALTTSGQLHWVLVPAGGISAGAAYAELDRLRSLDAAPPPISRLEELVTALAAGDVRSIADCLGNDLQAAAVSLAPHLARTLEVGLRAGGLTALVSGSGPTVALLCADAAAAAATAGDLRERGLAVHTAVGPVAARVDGAGPVAAAQVPG